VEHFRAHYKFLLFAILCHWSQFAVTNLTHASKGGVNFHD
jgi:hypothetical protein